jgi:hypothetical protein
MNLDTNLKTKLDTDERNSIQTNYASKTSLLSGELALPV